ncbi:hypothetical protein [Streptomyces sp. NRRL F-5123]|uniref:hypothetical protein n=1 Tax=Streptomyces sp. NRRL F-5123 TaxID=1463856 RepID=UPI0004E234C4|nr:hypothetical protein [Streptomyces sp. NRRL F-5123]
MTGATPAAERYVERPQDPDRLLPYLGCRITALPDGSPPWSGVLIALGERAHIRAATGEIKEFPLPGTVFAVPRFR